MKLLREMKSFGYGLFWLNLAKAQQIREERWDESKDEREYQLRHFHVCIHFLIFLSWLRLLLLLRLLPNLLYYLMIINILTNETVRMSPFSFCVYNPHASVLNQ